MTHLWWPPVGLRWEMRWPPVGYHGLSVRVALLYQKFLITAKHQQTVHHFYHPGLQETGSRKKPLIIHQLIYRIH